MRNLPRGLIFLLAVSFAPLSGSAATFLAGELTDAADPTPDDGVCDVDPLEPGEQCTLRAAIQTANALDGPDTVQLVAGTYRLKLRGPGEDLAASDDLDVLDTLLVLGQGAGVSILDARRLKHRVFDVFGALDLVNVTLVRGKGGKAEGDRSGGCIRSADDLVVINAVLSRCKAREDGGAIAAEAGSAFLQDTHLERSRAKGAGGGISVAAGTLLDRVTASRNRARSGGAFAVSAASLGITSSTLSGNQAREGGALWAGAGASLSIGSSTVAFNKARVGRALANAGSATLQNSIVHAKKSAACSGAGSFVSEGGNLASDASCGLGLATDQTGDPRLAKLADNGGPTPTHALAPDSPAIDAALDAECPATDQRSQPRVDFPGVGVGDAVCDAGAFEATP